LFLSLGTWLALDLDVVPQLLLFAYPGSYRGTFDCLTGYIALNCSVYYASFMIV
jgi:hypothetical protein